MKKTKTKVIEIPIYHGDLILIQCETLKSIYEDYELEGYDNGVDAIVFKSPTSNGYTQYFMAFKYDSTKPNVIAHEAFHVVTRIFYDRSIDLDLINDEPVCYLLEWIVKQCHEFLTFPKLKV